MGKMAGVPRFRQQEVAVGEVVEIQVASHIHSRHMGYLDTTSVSIYYARQDQKDEPSIAE